MSSQDGVVAVVQALRRIIRAVDQHSKFLAQRYGLTGPQLAVLQYLATHEPSTTGEIAGGVSLGQATLSNILDRLEARKLVKRTRSAEDKRRVMNELTPEGRGAIDQAPPLLHDRFAREFGKLEDWERGLLLSSLQRVAKMMDADAIEASPFLMSGPMAASAEETVTFLSDAEADTPRSTSAKKRRS